MTAGVVVSDGTEAAVDQDIGSDGGWKRTKIIAVEDDDLLPLWPDTSMTAAKEAIPQEIRIEGRPSTVIIVGESDTDDPLREEEIIEASRLLDDVATIIDRNVTMSLPMHLQEQVLSLMMTVVEQLLPKQGILVLDRPVTTIPRAILWVEMAL
jgi:hypothetical protein